jgi:hypothetical protein
MLLHNQAWGDGPRRSRSSRHTLAALTRSLATLALRASTGTPMPGSAPPRSADTRDGRRADSWATRSKFDRVRQPHELTRDRFRLCDAPCATKCAIARRVRITIDEEMT